MMLVCTRPLLATDRYTGEARLIPGRSFVDSEHDIARRYPSHFAPAGDRGRRTRTAVRMTPPMATIQRLRTLPTEPRRWGQWQLPASTERCELRLDEPSPTPLRFTATARAELIAELDRADHECETGGLFYGGSSRKLVDVVRAMGAGPNAHRGPHSFSFDPEFIRQADAEMATLGLQRSGEFHSHVAPDARLSKPDLDCFAAMRHQLEVPAYAVVLAVAVRAGWNLEPFLIERGLRLDGLDAVCRRATISPSA